MSDAILSLNSKRLVLVTGKGGTGKSNLSLAIAHRLSQQGKRVWLVEFGRERDFSRLPELLGQEILGHQPTLVTLPSSRSQIYASIIHPTSSLVEYVNLKLPTAGLAGLLLNNRVTASFLEVVPGLPEMVSLGKIWHSVTHQSKPAPDCVVIDGPSTGHALSLLHAPSNFEKLTKVGPIYNDAKQMRQFLEDVNLTALVVAAIPEEMSVKETISLQSQIGGFPTPYIYLNKIWQKLAPLPQKKTSLPYLAYQYAADRAEREHSALDGLKNYSSIPYFYPEPGSKPLYQKMADYL